MKILKVGGCHGITYGPRDRRSCRDGGPADQEFICAFDISTQTHASRVHAQVTLSSIWKSSAKCSRARFQETAAEFMSLADIMQPS